MQRDSFSRIGSLSLWGRVRVGAAPTGGCAPTLPSPTEAVAKGPSRPPASTFVIPAQAGIQRALDVAGRWMRRLDSRLRGNDGPFAPPPRGGGKFSRQRGLSLIEFMVGLTIGLLVILAAVASLIILRGSSRTMTDSTALEQQATLAMLQIGQQLRQTGAHNFWCNNPDAGIDGKNLNTSACDAVQFDDRPIGVSADFDPLVSTTAALSTLPIFGRDGAGTDPDTLYISYAQSNDGSPFIGCTGVATAALPNGAVRALSVFTVDTTNNRNTLTCGNSTNSTTSPPVPIAANVINMRVKYLSVDDNDNVTYYKRAANVPNWTTINGVQICLELVGDSTQEARQPTFKDCLDKDKAPDDGRIHRIIRNTFYLHNSL